MKLLLVLTAALLPPALVTGMVATSFAAAGGNLEQPPVTVPNVVEEFFIEEIGVPADIDYSMLEVAPRNDREYFIETPPLPGPQLRDRFERGFDWLPGLGEDDPALERLDLGRYFPSRAEPGEQDSRR